MKISFGTLLAAFAVLPSAAAQSRLGSPTTTDAAATVYDIGVAAVHEPVAVVPHCDFTQAQDRMEQAFAALHDNDHEDDDTTIKAGRKLYNCAAYCYRNGFNPAECYYWSQGTCGGAYRRRMMMMTEVSAEDTEAAVPASVAEECLRHKKTLGLALKEEAAAAASLSSQECHDYFASGWELKCLYRVGE